MSIEKFPTNKDEEGEEEEKRSPGKDELFENDLISPWRKASEYEKTKKEVADAIARAKEERKEERIEARASLRARAREERKANELKKILELTKEITGQEPNWN